MAEYSSELSSYESDASLSKNIKSVPLEDDEEDELESLPSEIDELEEDELEEDYGYSFPTAKPKAQSRSSKSKSKSKKSSTSKMVHFDPVHIPMGEKSQIDKFISWRMNGDVEEILVKYKNMSYLSSEWVPRTDLETDRNVKNRVKRFLEKPAWENQWSEDEPYNPAFNKIDRIIDEGEANDTVYYLVKWTSLTYDLCTWESAETVQQLDAEKISEYHDRRTCPDVKKASYASAGRKGVYGKWKKLEESPVYKNDNTLRAYQLEGLNWLMFCWFNKRNSILADEMGLGKTIQSTAFLNELYQNHNIKGPFLIVTPLSTMGNWEREIRTWTDMNVVVYHGNNPSRNLAVETEFYYKDSDGDLIPDIYKFDIILTTYEMAMAGAAQLRPVDWRAVVLDEAHRLKNKSSKVSELLKTYKMEHRVLLTGTPLQNSLDELWALLNFLEPLQFPSEDHFKTNYGSLNTAADVEKLQSLLKPLMLRRLKEDVETSIPVKEETIVEVELTTMQKKWYRSILEKNFSWIKQGAKKNNVPNLVNTMIELRKCCIHPWLLNGAEDQILDELDAHVPEKQFEALIQSSGKMVLIDKLLKKLKDGGHKVLIFSQMTKCLDLIQEYLRGRRWLYERIDGNVRGDLRQASIDRFSEPNSESFVFLLSTRSGGVGINLTAADTCIIFDSDWNPQNDLQAQSRCHRIGQKKSVKIYRLVTRNTYEQEMFDRASMKLGLDKAVLQRLGNSSEGPEIPMEKGGPASMSKQEIEDLLKKGAYGAFIDDDASKQFCEEDIDQILERRTQVIRHDAAENEKGSIFSKASFQATSAGADLDVNDPTFWDKVAEMAKLELPEDIDPEMELIMDVPRNRRQVRKFGADEYEQSASEDEADVSSASRGDRPVSYAGIKLHSWTLTERNRLERVIMQHGFHNFRLVLDQFPHRTIEDLKACIREMLIYSHENCPNVDDATKADVRRALAIIPPPIEGFDRDAEYEDPVVEYPGEEPPELPVIAPEDQPYPGATWKEKREFATFLTEAPKEYLEHLSKKAKSLLVRTALMYHVRNKNNLDKQSHMPKVLGAPPRDWWGPNEDRDLIIGVCKHGYQQYNKIWADSEFCFYPRWLLTQDANGPVFNHVPDTVATPALSEAPLPPANSHAEETALVAPAEDIIPSEPVSVIPTAAATPVDTSKAMEEVEAEAEITTTVVDDDAEAPAEVKPAADPVGSKEPSIFPTPTELGVRIRRILNALSKYKVLLARQQARVKAPAKNVDSSEAPKSSEKKNVRPQTFEFAKKTKQDFQRALLICGAPRHPTEPNKHDWTMVRRLADLQRKSDESIEHYFNKLMKLARQVVAVNEAAKKPVVEEDQYAEGPPPPPEAPAPVPPVIDTDGETLTYDKAKKIVNRVEAFDQLREILLKDPELETKLNGIKRHGKQTMPKWWEYEYDKYFLIASAKYGLNRWEEAVADLTMPFQELYQQYLRSMEYRKANNIPPEAVIDEKFEEKFWMRDSVAIKRFDLLVSIGMNPLTRGRKKKSTTGKPGEVSDLDSDMLDPTPPPSNKPAIKLKFKMGQDDNVVEVGASADQTKSATKRSRATAGAEKDSSSGGDTDDMLATASKRLEEGKKKKKKKTKGLDDRDKQAIADELRKKTMPHPVQHAVPHPHSAIPSNHNPYAEHYDPYAPRDMYRDPMDRQYSHYDMPPQQQHHMSPYGYDSRHMEHHPPPPPHHYYEPPMHDPHVHSHLGHHPHPSSIPQPYYDHYSHPPPPPSQAYPNALPPVGVKRELEPPMENAGHDLKRPKQDQ